MQKEMSSKSLCLSFLYVFTTLVSNSQTGSCVSHGVYSFLNGLDPLVHTDIHGFKHNGLLGDACRHSELLVVDFCHGGLSTKRERNLLGNNKEFPLRLSMRLFDTFGFPFWKITSWAFEKRTPDPSFQKAKKDTICKVPANKEKLFVPSGQVFALFIMLCDRKSVAPLVLVWGERKSEVSLSSFTGESVLFLKNRKSSSGSIDSLAFLVKSIEPEGAAVYCGGFCSNRVSQLIPSKNLCLFRAA